MARVYNFSSGPAMQPEWVLKRAKEEMLEYGTSGQSVMEMSHRSADFLAIIESCKNNLRELMDIPDDYEVLFVPGGASLQFSMIPMNLAKNKVQIINTGEWTKKAYIEHKKIVPTEIIASSEKDGFTYIPDVDETMIDPAADYLYICQNNTIYGSRYHQLPPDVIPLVADLSSMILSEPIDVRKYGLLFAGAQKNMGPAGICVVVIKKDLIKKNEELATMLSYYTYATNGSLFNTPPTYTLYICDLVFQWLKTEIGGLQNMKKINEEKAGLLYDFIDQSQLFSNYINKRDRSIMNVTFVTGNPELDKQFIAQAKEKALVNLGGHKTIGGMRASIYNAMPLAGVHALIEFMKEFEVKHG